MAKDLKQLGEFQLSALREIGNIGTGHATTALSTLLNQEVDMTVPQAAIVPFDKISDFVGGPENVVIAIFQQVTGDINGNIFLILSIKSAKRLLEHLVNNEKNTTGIFSELELSALNEIGNILVGSYLSSLADFTNLNIQITVPAMAMDMAGAILSYGLIELSQIGDFAIAIDTKMFQDGEEVEGHIFLLPNPDSITKLFTVLGVPL